MGVHVLIQWWTSPAHVLKIIQGTSARPVSSVVIINNGHLKTYGYTSIFSAMLSKGDNFRDFLSDYL